MLSYLIVFVLSLIVLLGASVYVFQRRHQIDEMHGMMVGMTFGMVAGLITATLFLIPTGNFLWGVIIGSLVGLAFGVPFGKIGGHLGLMEGVVAGPMGGMMGAMLGQMIRPFNIEIFMPFFMFIFLITMLGISYAVHCGVSCCKKPGKKPGPVSTSFLASWIFAAIILIGASIFLTFSIAEKESATLSSGDVRLPAYLQNLNKEDKMETVVNGDYQEIVVLIANSAYSPNTIVARKGIPLRITLRADSTAGCARDIIFPDFKIRKIVPDDTPVVIELSPNEAGTFKFHCSMDMARGKLIVQ